MKGGQITDKWLDIGTDELGRIGRLFLLNKVVPLGGFGGGPGLRCLLILFVVHRLGRPLFRLLMPQEDRLTRLYVKFRKRGAPGVSREKA